ncbi:hypothetical protein [Streptomyces sp. SudanB135_2055]|uniref:hypothetical protein n=1 Tax=Streptomyces sp. SudanB135_2055 TaxID=3035279 RepID=UPI0036DB8AF7
MAKYGRGAVLAVGRPVQLEVHTAPLALGDSSRSIAVLSNSPLGFSATTERAGWSGAPRAV